MVGEQYMRIVQHSITINLAESLDAKSFQEHERINKEAFDRVIKLINNEISKLESDTPHLSSIPTPNNNTIAIFGGRGSGKSSFLYSLKEHCDTFLKDQVLTLNVIDPTLVESKGHLLLHILSLLEEYVDDIVKDPALYSNEQIQKLEKRAWKDVLNKLAKGLCSIDGVESANAIDWDDDNYVMRMGMGSVTAARNLQNNFEALIEKTLRYKGKSLLVLFFDDIDVDPSKAWKVMEVIRKYLTSPKILTIVSGDEKLLALSVRKHQWELLGDTFLSKEDGNRYGEIRNSLEDQYLHKIVRSDRRVRLQTLKEIVLYSKRPVKIIPSIFDNASIDKIYQSYLREFGIFHHADQEVCMHLLLGLPLRTQIQLLSTLTQNSSETNANNPHRASLEESLRNTFSSTLLQSDLPAEGLFLDRDYFVIYILRYLVTNKDGVSLSDSYQLQPITTSSFANETIFALGSLLSLSIKDNPHLILDFMLRIGYVRNTIDKPIERPTGYLFEDRNLRDLAGYHLAQQTQPIGAIPLYALNVERGIARALTGQPLEEQVLGYLPFSIIYHTTKKRDASYYYSLPSLLGGIYDILRSSNDQLEHLLVRWSQPKAYSVSYSPLEETQDEEQELSQSSADDSQTIETSLETIMSQIVSWKENLLLEDFTINPLLLGRIMTRYTVATDSLKPSSPMLGDVFSQHLVLFLNSVLVEEYLWGDRQTQHTTINAQVNLNNPVEKPTVFINNLKKIEGNDYPLFSFFSSCPLVLTYLDPEIRVLLPVPSDISSIPNLYNVFSQLKTRISYNLPSFSTSSTNINATVDILKRYGIRPSLFSKDFAAIKSELEEYFKPPITSKSVDRMKTEIDKGLTW